MHDRYTIRLFSDTKIAVDTLNFANYVVSDQIEFFTLLFNVLQEQTCTDLGIKLVGSNETQMAYSYACHEDIELDFAPSGDFSWLNDISSSGASPDEQAFALDQTILGPDGVLHHPMQGLWQKRRLSIPPTKLEIEAMERAERRAQRNKNQHPPEDVFETACEIEAMEQAKRRAQRNTNQHLPEDVFETACEIEAMEQAKRKAQRNTNQHLPEDVFETACEIEAMEQAKRKAQRNTNQHLPEDVFETACDEDGPGLDADKPDLDEDDQEVSPRLRRTVRRPWQSSRGRRRRLGRCHSSEGVLDADWVASLREHAARGSTKPEETAPRRRVAPVAERRNGVCARLDETAAVRMKARVFQKRL